MKNEFDKLSPKTEIKLLVFGQSNLTVMGGVQLSYTWLFNYLCQKGYKIRFYTHVQFTPSELYYPFPEQVELLHYNLKDNLETRKTIAALAHEYDPHVILVCNSSQNASILTTALYKTKYPVVLSERGSPEYCVKHLWKNALLRHVAFYSVEFSHMLMKSYRDSLPRILRKYTQVIQSPTQSAKSFASPDKAHSDKFIILYTGRLSFEKDIDILIKAFKKIYNKYQHWELRIVGDGIEAEALRNLIKENDLESKIQLPGFKNNMSEVEKEYISANIFVLPSRSEGCPLALREAMAHGLPVIGFDSCPGTNEIIKHDSNGLLAKSANKIEGLAESIEKLINDPALRLRLGQQGIIDAKQYNPDTIHSQWDNLLRRASSYKGIKKKRLHLQKILCFPLKGINFYFLMKRILNNNTVKDLYIKRVNLFDFIKIIMNIKCYCSLYGAPNFNPQYYLEENYVIKDKQMDPLLHYITEGWKMDLKPSSNFDPTRYIKNHMQGKKSECPLYHNYKRHMNLTSNKKVHVMDILIFFIKRWFGKNKHHWKNI